MIPLIKRLMHALLWDELAARRWSRGALLWAGGVAVQLVSVEWATASAWTWREWLWRIGAAAVLGAGGMVTAGERNPVLDRRLVLPP